VTDPDPQDAPRPTTRKPPPLLVESVGGWRGLFDSGLPVVVFIAANAIGGLTPAIWAAIGAGALLMIVRLLRKQTVQQAVSGFFGVAVAAYIASRTGEAKGFFLLGIWASFGYAAIFLTSVLVRWPLVGLIWEYVDGDGGKWRKEAVLMRVYTWTTLVWVAVFLSRGTVQRLLYEQDRTGWLAVARLTMGYPLTVGALAVTVIAVRRVRRTVIGDDPDGPSGPEPAHPPKGAKPTTPAPANGVGPANGASSTNGASPTNGVGTANGVSTTKGVGTADGPITGGSSPAQQPV
jgi:hypothetical protein